MAERDIEIDRASEANYFVDAKLRVSHELDLPELTAIPSDHIKGSIAIGPNKKIIYKSDATTVVEVATMDDVQGFVTKAEISGLFPVSYQAPSVSISSTQSTSGLEIGQVITIPITSSFTQRDAGALSGTVIQRDGSPITSPDTDVVMTPTPKVYRAIASYGQGPIKNNQLGDPMPTGRIAAGSVTSNTLSYRGYYFIGYGAVNEIPAINDSPRNLPGKRLSSDNNTFILDTGVVFVTQVIIISPDKTLSKVIDLDALNLDVTSEYILQPQDYSVNDASGLPINNYKLYVRTQTVPYTTSHRHQITLI